MKLNFNAQYLLIICLGFSQMKSELFTRTETIQRINQQIQTLRSHPHIQNIEKLNDFTYTIMYHPSSLNCPYKQKSYELELILPTNYPNDPPSLRFLDQIYHLNIGYNSGEVRMPILQDDWSPFLSLNSIFESLESIMESPDDMYSLDQKILDLYQTDKDKYFSKVIQEVSLCDVVLCYSAQKNSPLRNIDQSDISSLPNQYSIKKPYSPNKKNKSSILIEEFRKSMDDQEKEFCGEEMLISQHEQTGNFPTLVKAQSKEEKKFNSLNNKSKRGKLKESIEMDQAKSIEAVQIQLNRPKIRSTQSKNVPQEHKNHTLVRINQTLKVFIEQLNQIENQIQLTKNKEIKSLLSEKHSKQLGMLKELMELSESAKRKMVTKLKQEVNKL